MHGDNVGCHHGQVMLHCQCRWASFLDGSGGAGRVLWIVDGTQIKHQHLPMFALGMTRPEHD